jgi:cytochrome d ubiquinol oxidase subunit II
MSASTHGMLAHLWFGLIGLMLVIYVVTDGFDIGVGILSLGSSSEQDRDQMYSAIGHVWDANETWLVVLGGALFGAFPQAYALLLHTLYVPVMVLIGSLIMRGAAIEFRHVAKDRRLWDIAFGIGSLGAALAQGVILGSVITGLQPGKLSVAFILTTALGVVSGYALLGSTYLINKASGTVEESAKRIAGFCLACTVACALALTVVTFALPDIGHERWREPGVFTLLMILGALSAASVFAVARGLFMRSLRSPFQASVALFMFSFCGLATSLFPDIVPGTLSIAQAASDTNTLVFMLCGIGFLFPVMIGYNLYQYYVFRGKVGNIVH